jgi:hypothetical protein
LPLPLIPSSAETLVLRRDGRHGGRIALKLPGQRELRVLADHPSRTYQATRRVVLMPDG